MLLLLAAAALLRSEEVLTIEVRIPRPGPGFVPWKQKYCSYVQSTLGGVFRRTCDQGLPGAPEAAELLDRLAEVLSDLPGAPSWDDLTPRIAQLRHLPWQHPVLHYAIGITQRWQPEGQGLALDSYTRAWEGYAAGDFPLVRRFWAAQRIVEARLREDLSAPALAWMEDWIRCSVQLLHDPCLADPVARSLISDWLADSHMTGALAVQRQQAALLTEIAMGGVDPWLADMITGRIELSRALAERDGHREGQRARPAGHQDQVSFLAHLARAQRALTAAWTRDATVPDAASAMIEVALAGGAGIEQEVTWFERALAAQMDFDDAWNALFQVIQPEAGGSQGGHPGPRPPGGGERGVLGRHAGIPPHRPVHAPARPGGGRHRPEPALGRRGRACGYRAPVRGLPRRAVAGRPARLVPHPLCRLDVALRRARGGRRHPRAHPSADLRQPVRRRGQGEPRDRPAEPRGGPPGAVGHRPPAIRSWPNAAAGLSWPAGRQAMLTISMPGIGGGAQRMAWAGACRLIIATVLWAAASPAGAQDHGQQRWDEATAQSAPLYARIRAEFAAAGLGAAFPGLTIAADARGAPVIRYQVRTWQVYGHGMGPEFNEALSPEEGPLSTGLLLSFNAYPIEDVEQQIFASGITAPAAEGATVDHPFVRQEPYWISSTCGVTIPQRKLRFIVITAFNHHTPRKLLDDIFQGITRALATETLGDLDP